MRSADLVAIAKKATATDPDQRYASPQAFADDLQRWLDRRPPAAHAGLLHLPRSLWLWGRRNVAWAVSGLTVLIMILGASAVAYECAETGRKAAEQESRRLAQEQQLERALLEAQTAALKSPPDGGWKQVVEGKLRRVLELRPDACVRNQAAATLIGLDVTPVFEETVRAIPGRIGGFSSVAFSPDGTRVVVGGWGHSGVVPVRRAHYWDGNNAHRPAASALPGAGPVAYPDADSPLQLVVTPDPQIVLTLFHVEKNTAEAELPLPEPVTVSCAALSADAQFAAACVVPARVPFFSTPRPTTILWSIGRKSGKVVVKKLREWPQTSTALTFSPGGNLLAIGSDAGEVTIRTTEDGAVVDRFLEGGLAISASLSAAITGGPAAIGQRLSAPRPRGSSPSGAMAAPSPSGICVRNHGPTRSTAASTPSSGWPSARTGRCWLRRVGITRSFGTWPPAGRSCGSRAGARNTSVIGPRGSRSPPRGTASRSGAARFPVGATAGWT